MANEFIVKNGLVVSGSTAFLGPTTGFLNSVNINAATQSLQQYTASLNVWTSSIHIFTASVIRDSASFDSRINLKTDQTVFVAFSQSIHTYTASAKLDSASFDSRINLKTDQTVFTAYSQSTNLWTASVKLDSASFDSRINLKTDQTVFTTYSQSINTFTASVTRDSASFDSRINLKTDQTVFVAFSQSINLYTASAKLDSASFDSRINLKTDQTVFTAFSQSHNVWSASINTYTASAKLDSASFDSRINLKTDQTVFTAYSQSINTWSASVKLDSASFDSRINLKTDQTVFTAYSQSHNVWSASINSFTASVTRDSASFDSRINLKTDQTVFVAFSQSIHTFTASVVRDSASFDSRILFISKSYFAFTQSYYQDSASFDARINSVVGGSGVTNATFTAYTASMTGVEGYLASFSSSAGNALTSSLLYQTGSYLALGTKFIRSRFLITEQTSSQAPLSNTTFQIVGMDDNPLRLTLDTHNSASNFGTLILGRRSRGNSVTPAAVQSNDVLLQLGGMGYGTTAYASSSRAIIDFKAAENWTDTAQGTLIQFYTTPINSIAPSASMQLNNIELILTGSLSITGSSSVLNIESEFTSSTPSSPNTGVTIFPRYKAGRRMLAQVGPSGVDYSFQPALFANKIGWWSAMGNTATIVSTSSFHEIVTGSKVARNVSFTEGFLSQTRRVGYTTVNAASQSAGTRHGVAQFGRGVAAGQGGFYYVTRFGIQNTGSNWASMRIFVGLMEKLIIPFNEQPTQQVNCLYVGKDSGSNANFEFGYNDSSGTATTQSISSSITFNVSGAYEFRLFCPPNGSTVYFGLTRLDTNQYAEWNTSTNIPSPSSSLAPQMIVNTGANTMGTISIDPILQYIETDN